MEWFCGTCLLKAFRRKTIAVFCFFFCFFVFSLFFFLEDDDLFSYEPLIV